MHTHHAWGVWVFWVNWFSSITSLCHATPKTSSSLPVVFFLSMSHWHPNFFFPPSAHIIIIFPSPSQNQREALPPLFISIELYDSCYAPHRFVSSVVVRVWGLLSTIISNHPTAVECWCSCSKSKREGKNIHGDNCLLNIGYALD